MIGKNPTGNIQSWFEYHHHICTHTHRHTCITFVPHCSDHPTAFASSNSLYLSPFSFFTAHRSKNSMAEREALQKRYAYAEMSNKVEQADRSQLRGRRREPTGEVETLRGRGDAGRMGDRVVAAPEPTRKKAKTESVKPKKERVALASAGQTILDMDVTGYQPSTPGAKRSYESLLVGLIEALAG